MVAGPVKEGVVGPADRSGSAGTPAASAVLNGIVSRPGLFARLDGAGRVTEVSAPAGSGKTLLLRSWIAEADLAGTGRAGTGAGRGT